MTSTSRFGWDIPTPGASKGTWGDTLNDLIDDEIEEHTWIGQSKTSDYTASNYEYVFADSSTGDVTITLPPADVDVQVGVKKTSGSGNVVTIATPGSETIDGSASVDIGNENHALTILSDGADYFVIAYSDASVP